jgi:hypothetical protein
MPLDPPNNEGWPLPITWRAWRELGRSLAAHLISAMASFIGTFFCHPDAHLGFLFAGVATGQGLSLPMDDGGGGLAGAARITRRTASAFLKGAGLRA